jgi:hypothetical protein
MRTLLAGVAALAIRTSAVSAQAAASLPFPCAPQSSYIAKAFKALSKSDAINVGKSLGLSEKTVAALRGEECVADDSPDAAPKISANDPSDVTVGRPADIPQDIFARVRRMCVSRWPEDFSMRASCERWQFEDVRKLRGGR